MKTSGYAGNAGMDGIMQAAKLLVGKGRICNVQKYFLLYINTIIQEFLIQLN